MADPFPLLTSPLRTSVAQSALRLSVAALVALPLVACGGAAPAPPEIPAGFAADDGVAALLESKRAAALASPGKAAPHLELGLALSVNGGPELAETCFRNALAVDADHAEARYQLASVRGELGANDEQIAELRRVLQSDGDFHAARYDLACALLDLGELDDAEREFETLLSQVPDAALAQMGVGLVQVERGKALEGIPHLIKAFETYPQERFIRFRLGQAYREIGEDRKADQLLEGIESVGGRPRISSEGSRRARTYEVGGNARLNKANAHLKAGKPGLAITILEPLLEASPDDFNAGMSLVAGYLAERRTDEAMALVERMAALRPEHHLPVVQQAACHLQRADALREAKDTVGAQRELAAALRTADRAATIEPELGEIHLRRAAALAGLRRDEESLAAYRRAVELGETSERVYRDMIGPAERSGGIAEAERVLREGISKGVDRFRLRFELCGVYLRSGRGREARTVQRDMARRSADHPLTRRADQILTKNGL